MRTPILVTGLLLLQLPALADVVPDGTLRNERSRLSRQERNGQPSQFVTGGARRGTALFHSFRELSVDAGTGLYFVSPDGVQNILTRVTGGNPSRIDGTLGVLGAANLLLLNPGGLRFGPTARLELNGSFLATTATAVELGQFSFDAGQPGPVPPLLRVEVPSGLSFTQPAPLRVRGPGHQIDFLGPAPIAIDNPVVGAGQSLVGLRVVPGQTLALLGGQTALTGAVLSAPSGTIELAAVESGRVGLSEQVGGWNFNYRGVTNRADLDLRQLSLLDASGLGGGQIGLLGDRVSFSNGSYGLIQNIGPMPAGTIGITANQLEFIGTTEQPGTRQFRASEARSGLIGYTLGGDGADINLQVGSLRMDQGGIVRTLTYGAGRSGDITVESQRDVTLNRLSPLDSGTGVNVIQSLTFGAGDSGDIRVQANRVRLRQGSAIQTSTAGQSSDAGAGGSVRVDAGSIVLRGASNVFQFPSSISSSSLGRGDGGPVVVRAEEGIEITEGAGLGSVAFNQGDAGDVRVSANSILLSNVDAAGPFTGIYAAAVVSRGQFEVPLNLPNTPVGESGNLFVAASQIRIRGEGGISVTNSGPEARAGVLNLAADNLRVEAGGGVLATTNGGQGGDINLEIDRLLELRGGGRIDATARRSSRGGNIEIQAGAVAVLDNSVIRANAQNGPGGNIRIQADAIYQSPGSAITALSQNAPQLNGSIQIDAVDARLAGQNQQPVETLLPVPQVDAVCPSRGSAQNSFVVQGQSLPPSPLDSLESMAGWSDPGAEPGNPTVPAPPATAQPIEAQGWQRNPDGTLRFVATASTATTVAALNCRDLNHSNQLPVEPPLLSPAGDPEFAGR